MLTVSSRRALCDGLLYIVKPEEVRPAILLVARTAQPKQTKTMFLSAHECLCYHGNAVVPSISVTPSNRARNQARSLTLAPLAHPFPLVVALPALEGVADSMPHFQ